MVSTRGIKCKFTEGELVLCYEPDPAKTKVLYDSKILQIHVNRDDTGKKFLEFLIHFQGWNPTWDRFVTEDYVLKDTAENRQLQKELAEKAQLTSASKIYRGGNLYKRDRKKQRSKLSSKITESLEAKEEEASIEDQAEIQPPPLNPGLAAAAVTVQDDELLSDSSAAEDIHPYLPPITIPLSDGIRQLLEKDYFLITQSNKLLKLPAKPNALTILENYVVEYSMRLLSSNQENEKSSRSSTQPPKSFDSIRKSINLCKEVADGLRIYFDFSLKDCLLYNLERDQCNQSLFNCKIEPVGDSFSSPVKQETVKLEEVENGSPPYPGPPPMSPVLSDKDASSSADGNRRKSLRSHRTGGFEFTNGTSGKSAPLATKEELSPSMPSLLPNSVPVTTQNISGKQDAFMSQIMDWKLIPSNVLKKFPHLPSQNYGAVHLARLFVKLPELMPIGMAEKKLDVCLRHFSSILKYLESHPEWFDESHYQDNCGSMDVSNEVLTN